MPISWRICGTFSAVCFLLATPDALAAAPAKKTPAKETRLTSDRTIEKLLAPIREKHKVPGLIAGIVDERGVKSIGAVGFRKFASPEPLLVNDKLRLGSCTKSLTATQIALLVQDQKLSWQTTLGEVLTDIKPTLHDGYQKVTLQQLLNHRSGLPVEGPYEQAVGGTNTERRAALAKIVLSQPPVYRPGTKSQPSNLAYLIAAHLAERVTGNAWEKLIADGLFEQLPLPSAGFGFPGTKGKVDQPWGHQLASGKREAVQFQSPEVTDPAEGIVCTAADWGKFLAMHLTGPHGNARLLPPDAFRLLQTPPDGESFACGWQRIERTWANGWTLNQQGGGPAWHSNVWLAPELEVGFLAVTNQGGDVGFKACDEAIAELIGHYLGSLTDKQINALLVPIREKHHVPALVAGIVTEKGLTRAGAVGIRKTGAPEGITLVDKLHIGSDTKAMTATLLALLVEEKKLSWKSTVTDVFPHLKSNLHADFQNVSLEQLLTHRAGLPANANYSNLSGTVVEQRDALMRQVLSQAPLHQPGSKSLYSNVGYIIAGHFAEQATGRAWEELMTDRLFRPLSMSSAGFGPPGTTGRIDQPWGHRLAGEKLEAVQGDNPPVLGPAGRVHLTLRDWGKFVELHLQGARGKANLLLKPATFKVLHTPPPGAGEEQFAMGWGITHRDWTRGPVLTHDGSNTLWYATAWIAPESDIAFLAVANQGDSAGRQATDEAVAALIGLYKKSAGRSR
jgi:CubicO group peptidase (beta-lactamase class C family)